MRKMSLYFPKKFLEAGQVGGETSLQVLARLIDYQRAKH
jgi:hypothetical protein